MGVWGEVPSRQTVFVIFRKKNSFLTPFGSHFDRTRKSFERLKLPGPFNPPYLLKSQVQNKFKRLYFELNFISVLVKGEAEAALFAPLDLENLQVAHDGRGRPDNTT